MTTAANKQQEKLSRQELFALVIRKQEIIVRLEAEVAALKAELEIFRRPAPTSRNSSRLPSLDKKANSDPQKKKREKKRRGHIRQTQPLVDKPDRIIPAPATECRVCRANLAKLKPETVIRRQVPEIPPTKPFIIETRQHEVTYPHCRQFNRRLLPEGLESDPFFGLNLAARVVYDKQTQLLSYERIVATLRDLSGMSLSEGEIAAILRRAGECVHHVAEQIKEQVTAERVIKSDETSARVKWRNWGYVRRVFQLESELEDLLSRSVHNQATRNLIKRFLTLRDKLLVFLHDPDVPPTNKESERALRTSVIQRKVTNGFRSEWGTIAFAALQSVIATARLRGENVFDILVKLMGKPIDRYPQLSNP